MKLLNVLRVLLVLSFVTYFIFEILDSKRVKDEREALIQLKTFELVHKITVYALCVMAAVYIYMPAIDTIYLMLVMVFSFMYTEIFGKIYFRNKL